MSQVEAHEPSGGAIFTPNSEGTMATDEQTGKETGMLAGSDKPDSGTPVPGAVPPEDPAAVKARELEEAAQHDEEVDDIPAARDPAWGARVVIIGLMAIVAALGVTVAFFNDSAADVVTITGPAFAVISALVAAYFGIRAGSLANERIQGAAVGQPPPTTSEKQQAQLRKKNGRPALENGAPRTRRRR
jgi:hypothetical protein